MAAGGTDKQTFDQIFAEEVEQPLVAAGFTATKNSSSLRLTPGLHDLRLLRMSGRLARPGTCVSAIGFRHNFLRPILSDDPSKARSLEDFPRKFTFEDFAESQTCPHDYQPRNTGRWDCDTLNFASSSVDQVTQLLKRQCAIMLERIVPWALSLTPEGELYQLRERGEMAWCELRWIEDYESFLARA